MTQAADSGAMGRRSMTVQIDGMHCASCVRRVEVALESIDGIESASVSLPTERARLEYLGVPPETHRLQLALENAGFKIRPEGAQRSGLPGMTPRL